MVGAARGGVKGTGKVSGDHLKKKKATPRYGRDAVAAAPIQKKKISERTVSVAKKRRVFSRKT